MKANNGSKKGVLRGGWLGLEVLDAYTYGPPRPRACACETSPHFEFCPGETP